MIEYDELYHEVQKRLSEKNFLGKNLAPPFNWFPRKISKGGGGWGGASLSPPRGATAGSAA